MAMKRRKLQGTEAAGEEAAEPGRDPRKKKGGKTSPVVTRMERCANPTCRKKVEPRLLRPCVMGPLVCTMEGLCRDCAKPSGHQCVQPAQVLRKLTRSQKRRNRGGGASR